MARRHAVAASDSALFIAGGAGAGRSLARYASDHPGVQALSRGRYLDTVHASNVDGAWGVWLIVGLAIAFATLALINTAAMTTAERRDEFATIRLLGGTPATRRAWCCWRWRRPSSRRSAQAPPSSRSR